MKNLYESLVELASKEITNEKIKKLCIGLNFTYSEVENFGSGLAYTFLKEISLNECCISGTNFWGKEAQKVLKFYIEGNRIETVCALATINAILNNRKDIKAKIEPFKSLEELLNFSARSELLVIGHFETLAGKIKPKIKKLWIFDGNWEVIKRELPLVVPSCEACIITSSSLINKTLEEILEKVYSIPQIVLMGPSTPFAPEIFKHYSVKFLCGAMVTKPSTLFKRVCEGKNAIDLFKEELLKKVVLRV